MDNNRWEVVGRRKRPGTSRKTLLFGGLVAFALLWTGFLYFLFAPASSSASSHIDDAIPRSGGIKIDVERAGQDPGRVMTTSTTEGGEGMHIIVQFPVLGDSLDGKVTRADRLHRQMEYTEALIENLVHPAVECVHLLLERDEDRAFIEQQVLAYPHAGRFVPFVPNAPPTSDDGGGGGAGDPPQMLRLWRYVAASGRVRFVRLGRWMLYSDAFGYARRELPGRVCVVQNSDISLSLAPDHVATYQRLASSSSNGGGGADDGSRRSPLVSAHGHSKVFILSRSQVHLPSCSTAGVRNCVKAASAGSYDTYIFRSPLPESLEWQTPMPQNIWGAENRVIWTLKCLNISVTNPCLELVTVHHHCKSSFRPTQQEDPIALPRVKYDTYGAYAFPPRKPATSIEQSMLPGDFPAHDICHHFPWNGPEGRSPEDIAAQRREEAAKPKKAGGGWRG